MVRVILFWKMSITIWVGRQSHSLFSLNNILNNHNNHNNRNNNNNDNNSNKKTNSRLKTHVLLLGPNRYRLVVGTVPRSAAEGPSGCLQRHRGSGRILG